MRLAECSCEDRKGVKMATDGRLVYLNANKFSGEQGR